MVGLLNPDSETTCRFDTPKVLNHIWRTHRGLQDVTRSAFQSSLGNFETWGSRMWSLLASESS